MYQQTQDPAKYSPDGHYYLVTREGEHGPYDSYDEAVDAASDPMNPLHGIDTRGGYAVVDKGEPDLH